MIGITGAAAEATERGLGCLSPALLSPFLKEARRQGILPAPIRDQCTSAPIMTLVAPSPGLGLPNHGSGENKCCANPLGPEALWRRQGEHVI